MHTTVSFIIFAVVLSLMQIRAVPILEKRRSRSGEGTFYDVGLGSCGDTNSDDDMVAAISSSLMNGGSYCGKSITVSNNSGSSVTLKVVDSCPGCNEGDIDMSRAAFAELAQISDGRIPITWSIE